MASTGRQDREAAAVTVRELPGGATEERAAVERVAKDAFPALQGRLVEMTPHVPAATRGVDGTDAYFSAPPHHGTMSLRTAVAAPFRQEGTTELGESAFVVALSLDRDWFSPDQAKRLVDVAASEGLIDREDGRLMARFDPQSVGVPEGFEPDESILQARSTFERVLGALVEAGHEKQAAVAAVNGLQADLAVTVETAAILYAHRQGVDVQEHAEVALAEL